MKLMHNTTCLLFFLMMTMIVGCTPSIKSESYEKNIGIRFKNSKEMLSFIHANSNKITPIKAVGRMRIVSRESDGKTFDESFDTSLRILLPDYLYFYANHLIIPKAVTVGMDDNEFWVWFKPKEINSFYYGNRNLKKDMSKFILDPTILLEAIGYIGIDQNSNQYEINLERDVNSDILIVKTKDGNVIKEIFINIQSRQISKIEYKGSIEFTAKLSDYKQVKGHEFFLPGEITFYFDDNEYTSLKFSSFNDLKIDRAKMQKVSQKPSTYKNAENIYWLDENSKFIKLK